MNSSGQYQRQLNKWGFRKSLQSSSINWSFIGRRTEKRKLHQGKDSEVYINGVQLPPQKLKRVKYREAFTTSEAVFSGGKIYSDSLDYTVANACQAPSPDTPEGVIVCTPATPGVHLDWNPTLPWLRFARILRPELGPGMTVATSLIPVEFILNVPPQIHLLRRLRSRYPRPKSSMLPLKPSTRSSCNAWFRLCRGINSANPQTYIAALVQQRL
jgi:hypothetical protein